VPCARKSRPLNSTMSITMGASQSFFLSRMNAQSSLITDIKGSPPSELALHALSRGKRRPPMPARRRRCANNGTSSPQQPDWRYDQIIDNRHYDWSGEVAYAFSKLHPGSADRFELSGYNRRRQQRNSSDHNRGGGNTRSVSPVRQQCEEEKPSRKSQGENATLARLSCGGVLSGMAPIVLGRQSRLRVAGAATVRTFSACVAR
jgi:hypothetical protein